MKRKYMLIILTSIMLGIFIGISIKSYNNNEINNKDKSTRLQIKNINHSIKELNKQKKPLELELETLKSQYNGDERIRIINSFKTELSYTDINSKGISIKIDALNDEVGNIANLVEYNRILINIINEVKSRGGKFISINGQRINQYTGVVLAGNHININFTPIAPPYNIEIIGNYEQLLDYAQNQSEYLKNIQNNYPIKLEIEENNSIDLTRKKLPDKLNYIEGE